MAEQVEVILRIRGSREFVAQATTAATSVEKVGKATDDTSKKADVAAKKQGRFAGALGRMKGAAVLGAAALGTFAVAGAVKAVNAASDLSEEMNKTGVVFGKSGGELLNWSKNSATALGQSREQALAAAGVFGNMLVPMGFTRNKAADMSKSMVGLASDMASFNNASPEETLDALRAGLAGESEPLRRFGVFLNDARLKQEAMNLGLYKGKGPLTAAAKAQATYALILKDTKDAQGDFQRTSGGLANQQRILKAQITNLSATVGAALLPVMLAGVRVVTKFIDGMKKGTGVGGAFVAVMKALWAVLKVIGQVVGFVVRNWKAFAAVLAIISPLLVAILAKTIAQTVATLALNIQLKALALWTKLVTAAQWLWNAAMAANPIGLVIAAIIALGIALVVAYKKVDWFRNAVDAAFKWIVTAARNVFEWVKSHWPLLVAILAGPFGVAFVLIAKNFGKIKAGVSDVWHFVQSTFGKIKSFIHGIFSGSFVAGIGRGLANWLNANTPFGDRVEFSVLGKSIGFTIPALAQGGTVTSGGAAVVGERGPEIVRLPPAAQVVPNSALSLAGAGAPVTITTQVFLDRRQIAEAVGTYAADRIARR